MSPALRQLDSQDAHISIMLDCAARSRPDPSQEQSKDTQNPTTGSLTCLLYSQPAAAKSPETLVAF